MPTDENSKSLQAQSSDKRNMSASKPRLIVLDNRLSCETKFGMVVLHGNVKKKSVDVRLGGGVGEGLCQVVYVHLFGIFGKFDLN